MIEHFADYKAQLVRLSEEHTIAFKEEMQEAFEHGFKSHYHENVDADDDSNQWQVLPDKDFYQSLVSNLIIMKMWMPTTIQTSGRCCLTRTSISH